MNYMNVGNQHRTPITEMNSKEVSQAIIKAQERLAAAEGSSRVIKEIELGAVLGVCLGGDRAVISLAKGNTLIVKAIGGNRREFLEANGGFPVAWACQMVNGKMLPAVPVLYGTWMKIVRELHLPA